MQKNNSKHYESGLSELGIFDLDSIVISGKMAERN